MNENDDLINILMQLGFNNLCFGESTVNDTTFTNISVREHQIGRNEYVYNVCFINISTHKNQANITSNNLDNIQSDGNWVQRGKDIYFDRVISSQEEAEKKIWKEC